VDSTSPHRLSQEIRQLSELCQKQQTTFGDLIEALGTRSSLILSIFLSLPFCLPIPVPGLSCFLGAIIFFLGVWMSLGKVPRLPKIWWNRRVPTHLFGKIFTLGEKTLELVESLVCPRLLALTTPQWSRRLNGLLIAYLGFLLALPYPPGTNFPPAANIILLSVGVLEEDGVVLLLGYIGIMLNTALFIFVTWFGFEGVEHLIHLRT
jgi:hypothetical protein